MAVLSGLNDLDKVKPVVSSGKSTSGTVNTPNLGATAVGTAKAVAAASGKQVASSGTQTPDYSIDYNDKRFTDVEDQKKAAIEESNAKYEEMIDSSGDFYQKQIDAANDYAETQSQIQQENTDFMIEQINQQKDQANKDYIREQQGAYVDWQKQSDQYGAAAEQMAASGLQNTGYSESSQVQMYNIYQSRVATARESYNQAVLNYDNSIKEAQLANNSALAEIAFNTLEKTLQLGLEGFQHENELMLQQMEAQRQIEDTYYNRWQDVLAQMNQENAMAEEIRQYNESLSEDRRQFDESMELEYKQLKIAQQQWKAEYDLQKREYEESIRQFDEEMARLKAKDTKEAKQAAEQLKLQKQQLQQEQKQWEKEMKEKKRQFDKQLAEEKRQYNKTYSLNSKKASSSSGGSSGGTTGRSINQSSGGGGTDEPKNNNDNQEKAATSSQKEKYNSFQTNIANMMMKNPSEKTIDNMAKQIEAAYESGKLTESQARKLLAQLD